MYRNTPRLYCRGTIYKILPIELKDFWEYPINIEYDDYGYATRVPRAGYYDLLQAIGYKLEQLVNNEWIPSDMIFNRNDRIYRVIPINKGYKCD